MPHVLSVSRSPVHGFSKQVEPEIRLLAGLGVEGDAHAGSTTQHLYRMRKDPTAPNLCQVHLLQAELFAELAEQSLAIAPGQMGENVTTQGVDLLGLPVGARLMLGAEAVVEITGLREPCSQMDKLQPGLMKACLSRSARGDLIRKAGVMGIVVAGGVVRVGDAIAVEPPARPWRKMGPV
jgi:MOSC domain-containing protein YiiM